MTDRRYQLLHCSTDQVSPGDRIDYWEGHVSGNHGQLGFEYPDTRDFLGKTWVQRRTDYRIGEPQFVRWRSGAVSYHRRRKELADGDDSARLVIPIEGTVALAHEDDSIVLAPGELGMISCGRQMALTHENDAHAWILTIPAHRIPIVFRDRPPLSLDAQNPLLQSVTDITRRLTQHRNTITTNQFTKLSEHAVDLVSAALDECRGPELTGLALLARDARTHIDRYSDDPGLTPASIADHLGCSKRKLEIAFRTTLDTSPAQLLRETRLANAYRRLLDRHGTIDDVAYDSGFASLSGFKHAFHQRYGISPGQVGENLSAR